MPSTHSYQRTIRFADVDPAGFVYFANYLSLCHEAYEESLLRAGMELKTFFFAESCLVPIGKCQSQFLGALQSGERARIDLTATAVGADGFSISYRVFNITAAEKLVALATTEHVCLDLRTLQRRALPARLAQWLNPTGAVAS